MISFTDATLLDLVASILLPLFRVAGLFTAAPVLSQRSTPMQVRVGLAFMISLLAAPTIEMPEVALGLEMFPLIAHEIIVGLTLGFIARLIFAAFEIAGEAIGLQMGLSFAGFFDPQSGAANPVARTINLTAITAFVMLNGPGLLVAAVIASFNVIPIDASFTWLAESSPALMGTAVFSLALSIALPFMMLLLFVNLALGIMSRVAPQFSVFAVGFPLTIGVGMTLLTFTTPLMDTAINLAMVLLADAMPA
ncbi:MAG: flagellar biosynthetic protein FliR [Burkholderiaceae bacterium]